MRLALWCYVLYRTYNYIRHAGTRRSGISALEGIMEQYLRDAISGHDGATSFVRHCWDRSYVHQANSTEESGPAASVERTVGAPKARARRVVTQRQASNPPNSSHAFFGEHLRVRPV